MLILNFKIKSFLVKKTNTKKNILLETRLIVCGFIGFVNNLKHSNYVLNSMMSKIAHRGPDDQKSFINKKIAIGFRRLSIVDLNNGNQPMFNEDKTKVLVCNGEIYNAKSLRKTLLNKGHKFASNSDSEVVLHSYEEYNSNMLLKLRGMFAFAIYDIKKQKIFAARDFFGIKPFYYYKKGSDFIFGSEIKSFLLHPNFQKQLNLIALEQFLSFQYSAYEETFFKNVFKLPPAHFLTFDLKNKNLKITKYYDFKFKPDHTKTLDDWIEQIGYAFKDSVNIHKISDVEVGSLLSSGIDSSLIAKFANVSKTFTVGFVENGYSEINYAKDFSKQIGVKNYNKKILSKEFWDVFPKIQYHMDEPLADASAVALYFACQTASKHVKVIMSGEGADEIFGGYNIYKEPINNSLYEIVPFFIRHFIANIASLFGQKRGINFIVRRGTRLENRFIGNANIFDYNQRKKLLNFPSYAAAPNEFLKPIYQKVKTFDDVTKMQFVDLNMWLVGDILQKADKMSMANSIELRVPFLDVKLFDVARKIPTYFRVNRKNTKFALRCFAQKNLPKFVAQKKKLGFPVPIRVWLKQKPFYEQISKTFTSEQSKNFFNTDELQKLLQNHAKNKHDESRKIWTIFSFLVWHKKFFC